MNDFKNYLDVVSRNVATELNKRAEELSQLETDQMQIGTSVPQLYGSLSRFVSNPSSVSIETFRRMLDTDETIGAGVEFLTLCMVARFGDYVHPIPEIQEFVRRCLIGMKGSWHQNLIEILSAEWAGFSTTEIVWQYDENFGGFPAYRPKRLVTYQPLTVVFSVDPCGEILPDGIHQYQRYHNSFGHGLSAGPLGGDLNGFRPDLFASVGDLPYPMRVSADMSYLTVNIPRSKIIHVTSSGPGAMGNPYGRSLLRRIYKNWVSKDAFLKMWVVAADRKGTPLVVGYADPHTTVDGDNEQPNGMRPLGSSNNAGGAPAQMAAAFRTIHNSSFIVLPGKKGEVFDLEAVQVSGDLNVFQQGVEYCNKAMMRGLLIPPLIMGGDGGGSFALGQEHGKNFDQTVDGKLKPYKQGILEDFIKPLIAYNFPRTLWEKEGLGDFALEQFDPDLMEKLSNVFNNLTSSGYMSPEDQTDMDEIRKRFGLPEKKAAEGAEPTMGGAFDMSGMAEDQTEHPGVEHGESEDPLADLPSAKDLGPDSE